MKVMIVMSDSEVVVNKEQLLKKIRALHAKTTENGCSEAEALAAAEKAAELLDHYGFAHSDLLEKEDLHEATYTDVNGQQEFLRNLGPAIAEYCDVKFFLRGRATDVKLVFFGRESDLETAKYLMSVFKYAFKREWNVYWVNYDRTGEKSEWYHVNKSFRDGMSRRLSERLHEMKAARNKHVDQETHKTGQELVELKNALVDNAFAEKYKLKKSRQRYYKLDKNFTAGYKAGDNVSINAAVSHAKKK